MLELYNTASDLGSMSETLNLHTYEFLDNTHPASQNSWKDCKKKVLRILSDAGQSPLDLILDILDPHQEEYESYHSRWFSLTYDEFSALLDHTFALPKGHDLLLKWFHPHLIKSVCLTVTSKINLVTKKLSLPSIEHVSSKFVSSWTLKHVIEPATMFCPMLLHILEVAAQTQEAQGS